MHVVYIHQHFSTKKGSSGTRSYEMSQRLIRAGHKVTMICGVNDATAGALTHSERVNEMDIDGIHVVCIAERYENRMGILARARSFYSFAWSAGSIIKSLRPDIVFGTSTPLTVGLPGMKGARRHRVPFVFEVRDLWPELVIATGAMTNRFGIAYLEHLEKKIYFAAQRIIALAPGIKDGICRTGYPQDRVAMIPNACDLDLFKPDAEPISDDRFGGPDEFRLVFTGAHGLANGLDAVIDAAAELKRRGEKGVRFIFIGAGGKRDHLVQRTRDEGLGDYCHWFSYIPKDELARLLPKMDVGMMILKNIPAFYYGTSPNKFFDYIACGLPVINNYPGWLAGMIEENRCGKVVPPDDPKAFADAVVWMKNNPDELTAMGLRARKLAETEFDRDKLGGKFVEVLETARAEFRG
jgi:glycosyltransferase involved in cell wall biosynthesis